MQPSKTNSPEARWKSNLPNVAVKHGGLWSLRPQFESGPGYSFLNDVQHSCKEIFLIRQFLLKFLIGICSDIGMQLRLAYLTIALSLLTLGYNHVYAADTSFFDSNVHIDVKHPAVVSQESKFTISTVLRAKNPDIANITMTLKPPEPFSIIGKDSIFISELKQDSTMGFTFELESKQDVTEGLYSINFEVNYERKEILGDYSKQSFSNAVVIQVKGGPDIVYSIKAPDSLFAGDTFPVDVELQNNGLQAKDVTVSILAPDDTTLIGQNKYSISKLESGEKFDFQFELKVSEEIEEAKDQSLRIQTTYLDTENNEYESTEKFTLFVRPRGFLEIGAAGGFWLGPVFISYMTGIGSIASAAVGFLIFIYRIKQGRGRSRKKEKKSRK